ncbi:alpha/beta family hydrolase [Plantactinospora sp. KLBMP9567]|uniref:alpha/beta hydrolase family protein n=1 Tax=Plantactinospora sp. KLBMP9567 TaxID=3085900 RepID=UPI0029826FCF|nr:alpha/beta family hydrolase [Plantactinospora sp. KLBMP9567]MDW5330360.1 alpha/beta family hydrolase [Plantactinospora sp. KLBMP9567]
MRRGDEIGTPRGPARVDVDLPRPGPTTLLVLGHGAGGSVDAPDLVALRDAAVGAGVAVARVTQPYRVAGRRAPAPAGQLDEAWVAVVTALLGRYRSTPTLVVGGRSSGARVACRTAGMLGASGIVALAFPLHPPGRPERSRAAELRTGLPTLVLNGDRDPFGVPAAEPGVQVEVRPGERHDLRVDPAGTAELVLGWLRERGWAG